jgi:dihydrofolate synthase / folylpolyglutamate synthase
LGYHNIKINKDVIRNGLKRCLWPARFEIISKAPLIIIDGAHNSASMIVLRKTLREFFPHKKVWVIFGISQDKELKDTCREIEKFNARIILTKADNPRAAEPQRLLRYFSNNSILLTHSTSEALNLAKSKIKKDDLILVTGSLFVCGEVRQLLNR